LYSGTTVPPLEELLLELEDDELLEELELVELEDDELEEELDDEELEEELEDELPPVITKLVSAVSIWPPAA
jgi:hypothetical protein